jgi:hypothetical protein
VRGAKIITWLFSLYSILFGNDLDQKSECTISVIKSFSASKGEIDPNDAVKKSFFHHQKQWRAQMMPSKRVSSIIKSSEGPKWCRYKESIPSSKVVKATNDAVKKSFFHHQKQWRAQMVPL